MGGKRKRYASDVNSTSSGDLKRYQSGWQAPLVDDDRRSGFVDLWAPQVAYEEDFVSCEEDYDSELWALLVEDSEEAVSHQRLPDLAMYYGDDEKEEISEGIVSDKWGPRCREEDEDEDKGQEIPSGRGLGLTSRSHVAGKMKRKRRNKSAGVRGFGLTGGPFIVKRKTRQLRSRSVPWLEKLARHLQGASRHDHEALLMKDDLVPNANVFKEWDPLPELLERVGEAAHSRQVEGRDGVPHHHHTCTDRSPSVEATIEGRPHDGFSDELTALMEAPEMCPSLADIFGEGWVLLL